MASLSGVTKSEITVLLMGDSGVGKSTAINGITLFMRFPSLAEAEKAELDLPIPVTVPVESTDADGVIKFDNTSSGNDENEDYSKPGQPVTQKPKVYSIAHKCKRVTIIDTPGMNDPRKTSDNEEQDNRNVDNIIATLAEHGRLNAVIILLNQAHTRLSAAFVNLFKKVFSNLSSAVKNNVIFLITNANQCMFKRGNAVSMLLTLLEEKKLKDIKVSINNVFLVDNMAVPYLVKFKNGYVVEDERPIVEMCWKRSATAMDELLQFTCSLKPVEIESIKILNKVNQGIMCIADPLVRVSIDIGLAEKSLEERSKRLDEDRMRLRTASGQRLRESLLSFISTVSNKPYEKLLTKQSHWSLICHKCNIGQHNNWIPRVCQERVTVAVYPIQCYIMKFGRCQYPLCGEHHAKYHEIVNFSYSEKKPESTDHERAIINLLTKMLDNPALIDTNEVDNVAAEEIENMKKESDKLKREQMTMLTVAAQLTVFLRQNSMGNEDLVDDVIGNSIDESLETSRKQRAENMVQVLEELKEEYRSAGLTESSRGNRLSMTDVGALIDELYVLPCYGAKLKQLADSRKEATAWVQKEGIKKAVIEILQRPFHGWFS